MLKKKLLCRRQSVGNKSSAYLYYKSMDKVERQQRIYIWMPSFEFVTLFAFKIVRVTLWDKKYQKFNSLAYRRKIIFFLVSL
jgi:hypothetical protein